MRRKFRLVRPENFDICALLRVSLAVVTTMSVLSAISTGFWSRLGDTHGRKLILSTFLIGALSMLVHLLSP